MGFTVFGFGIWVRRVLRVYIGFRVSAAILPNPKAITVMVTLLQGFLYGFYKVP